MLIILFKTYDISRHHLSFSYKLSWISTAKKMQSPLLTNHFIGSAYSSAVDQRAWTPAFGICADWQLTNAPCVKSCEHFDPCSFYAQPSPAYVRTAQTSGTEIAGPRNTYVPWKGASLFCQSCPFRFESSVARSFAKLASGSSLLPFHHARILPFLPRTCDFDNQLARQPNNRVFEHSKNRIFTSEKNMFLTISWPFQLNSCWKTVSSSRSSNSSNSKSKHAAELPDDASATAVSKLLFPVLVSCCFLILSLGFTTQKFQNLVWARAWLDFWGNIRVIPHF
jgi:hypothetical protein